MYTRTPEIIEIASLIGRTASSIAIRLTNFASCQPPLSSKWSYKRNAERVKTVSSNYSGKYAITGIDLQELLVASHIIPWSKNENERLNPENGTCLSALYYKAFDKGLIGINENYQILISKKLLKKKENDYYLKYFAPIESQKIISPQRYFPKKGFIQYHLDVIFNKSSSF
jgi:putative restriction endonuclease